MIDILPARVLALQAYGFTSQQFLFSVYGTLRAPSVQRMTSVVKQVGASPGLWHRNILQCATSAHGGLLHMHAGAWTVSCRAAGPQRVCSVVHYCRHLWVLVIS